MASSLAGRESHIQAHTSVGQELGDQQAPLSFRNPEHAKAHNQRQGTK